MRRNLLLSLTVLLLGAPADAQTLKDLANQFLGGQPTQQQGQPSTQALSVVAPTTPQLSGPCLAYPPQPPQISGPCPPALPPNAVNPNTGSGTVSLPYGQYKIVNSATGAQYNVSISAQGTAMTGMPAYYNPPTTGTGPVAPGGAITPNGPVGQIWQTPGQTWGTQQPGGGYSYSYGSSTPGGYTSGGYTSGGYTSGGYTSGGYSTGGTTTGSNFGSMVKGTLGSMLQKSLTPSNPQ